MAADNTFQASVPLYPAKGIPGSYAAVNPIVSPALGYTVKTAVTCGCFCWEDSEAAGQVVPSGNTLPLGLVVRDIIGVLPANTVAANVMQAGRNVNIAVEGDFWVKVTADVTKGQKVFASTTDGSVKGGSAGASVAGHVETNWEFATSASSGDTAIIVNHGQRLVTASAVDLSSYETSAHAASTYSTIANTVTAVEAGSAAGKIKVTKNGEATEFSVPE